MRTLRSSGEMFVCCCLRRIDTLHPVLRESDRVNFIASLTCNLAKRVYTKLQSSHWRTAQQYLVLNLIPLYRRREAAALSCCVLRPAHTTCRPCPPAKPVLISLKTTASFESWAQTSPSRLATVGSAIDPTSSTLRRPRRISHLAWRSIITTRTRTINLAQTTSP